MALHGVMIESEIQATNIDSLNKFMVSTVDIDGGNIFSAVPSATQGEDRFTATAPTATTLGGLYMAYNPSEHYTEVNGKFFAGLSEDPRDYTNIKDRTFTGFKIKKGDQVVLTIDDIDSTGESAVAGDILESKAGQTKLTRIAKATGATTGSTAFTIDYVGTAQYPQAGIGMNGYKVVKATCIQE